MVEAVANALVGLGHEPARIRTERFGPTGEDEMSAEGDRSTLDGNAAGGLLREVFAFEATVAPTTCAGCGRTRPMAELMLYAVELGAILRCPSCDQGSSGSGARRGGSGWTCEVPQPSWLLIRPHPEATAASSNQRARQARRTAPLDDDTQPPQEPTPFAAPAAR